MRTPPSPICKYLRVTKIFAGVVQGSFFQAIQGSYDVLGSLIEGSVVHAGKEGCAVVLLEKKRLVAIRKAHSGDVGALLRPTRCGRLCSGDKCALVQDRNLRTYQTKKNITQSAFWLFWDNIVPSMTLSFDYQMALSATTVHDTLWLKQLLQEDALAVS